MTDQLDAPADGPQQTTGRLVAQLSEQVARLVRDEVALAKIELAQQGKRLGVGAGMLGAAGVLALYAVAAGLVAAGLALALVLDGWLAALVVAGAILLVIAILAMVGLRSLRRGMPPVPAATVAGVRQDVATLQRIRTKGQGTKGQGTS
ncbi:MAG TPA: phage holin family protein [Mycobacteriales bacterium]|jgi:uncharacterized membrane protein YqjE|nr:phage holin family protein [Mycobacteriales bacterium]